MFDDKKYASTPNAFTLANALQPTTLTIYIMSKPWAYELILKDGIKAEEESWRLPPQEIKDFFDYMNDLANKAHLHTKSDCR